jgi:hypothetical protein
MPSSYTQTGIELIATGEQSGTWGATTNTNLQIIDRLTNGVGAISLSGTTHTLTTSDGVLSDGQYAVLVFGGSPSGTNTVTISPNDADHVYIVKNGSGQNVVLTQGSGGNVTVANGKSAIVYADGGGAGAAVVDLTSTFNFQPASAALTAIAALSTTDGNIIVGDGSTWVAESGDTALASLGVTATATELNYNDITTLGTSQASKVVTADSGGKVYINGAYRGNITAVSALDIDCSVGNYFTKTIAGNSTFTFSNAPSSTSYSFTLELTHTSGTVTWPTEVKWPRNVTPTLTTGTTHLFMFVTDDGGTRWRGAALVDYTN